MAVTATYNFPVQDIIEWDVLNWSQLMHYWQPVLQQLPQNSKVLAIGERNGGLSLWLALMGFDVVCTDITDVSAKAVQLHKKYNVADKIQYKVLDIVNDDCQAEQFDVVVAKSVIGGLKANRTDATTRSFDIQQQAARNIYRLLKPGGYFLSAENLQGNMLTSAIRRLRNGNNGWRHLAYHELSTLFAPFALVQTKTFGILPTLFSGTLLNKCMYTINKYALGWLPANTKYIAFITARK